MATAPEEAWEDLHWSLHRWAALLRDQGVASLFETVSSAHGTSPAACSSRPSGERFMTDLRHIAQLLHEAGVSEGLGPTAMATWLGRRIHDAERDADNEERARRLESDAEAVQVITIHRSKGLEFPVVYCPYAWDGYAKARDVPGVPRPRQRQPAHDRRRPRRATSSHAHQKLEIEEGRGEDLRLLYVALTRARHQAVLWWAGASDSQHSPLARLLFDRDPERRRPAVRRERHAATRPSRRPARRSGRTGGGRAGGSACAACGGSRRRGAPPALEAARFDRSLDTEWRRASYSSITRAAHDQPAIGSEPEPELG